MLKPETELRAELEAICLAHASGGAEASFVDELERLSTLREVGALTDEEFQVAKRKLLAS